MSLAATSMRGARLKARFAVKGIHSSSSEGIKPGSGAMVGSGDVAVILGGVGTRYSVLGTREYGTGSPDERGHRGRRRHGQRAAAGDPAPQRRGGGRGNAGGTA